MRAPSSAYPIQGRAQAFMESVSHNFCFGSGVKSVVAAAPVVIHREFGPWGRAVPTYVLARGLLLPASPHPGLLFAPNTAVTCGRRTGPCISPERRACSFPVSMSPFLWHSVTSTSAVIWCNRHFVSPKNIFLSGRKWHKFHAGVEDAGVLNVPEA